MLMLTTIDRRGKRSDATQRAIATSDRLLREAAATFCLEQVHRCYGSLTRRPHEQDSRGGGHQWPAANVNGYHDVPGERSVGRFPVGGWLARASI
jgi:hypothetical protein